MIKIKHRELECDWNQFKIELFGLAKLMQKHNPSCIGISMIAINKEFGLKLNLFDFYRACEQMNLKVWRGKFILISDILQKSI